MYVSPVLPFPQPVQSEQCFCVLLVVVFVFSSFCFCLWEGAVGCDLPCTRTYVGFPCVYFPTAHAKRVALFLLGGSCWVQPACARQVALFLWEARSHTLLKQLC